MRISRTSAYAISAMIQLAEMPSGVPVPCSQLAKAGAMPERFLLQILRSLVTHGLLKSTRGAEGGYSLARMASEISLLQILEASDGLPTAKLPPLACFPQKAHLFLQEKMRQIATDSCQHLTGVLLVDLLAPSVKEKDSDLPPLSVPA